jgi:uncharacterized protein (TIGR02996 family)
MTFDAQTRLSLIHGILSEPGEDAPRLIYADWLEEQGDSLGELIRLQLAMGQPWASQARLQSLRRRERELLDGLGVGRALSSEEVIDARYGGLPPGWCYAIVEGVPLLWIRSRAPADPLDLPPREWVERFGWFTVRIGTYDSYEYRYEVDAETLRRLFDWPLMERCIGLDMAEVERFYDDCGGLLATWPGAARLLRLGGFGTGVLASPNLAGLVEVDLRNEYHFGEAAVAALAAMPELRRLRVSKSSFKAGAIPALARLSGLRALDLSESLRLVDGDAWTLALGSLHHLVELNLERTGISDDGALALIRSPNLPHLRRLNLARTGIGARTVEELCRTDRFLRCGELQLHGCEGGEEMIATVARSPHAAHLRALTASGSACTDAMAFDLARSPFLKGLVKLFLARGEIGPEGAEALLGGSPPHLEELTLRGNPIGNRGALALARFVYARDDPYLDLWSTGVTAEGIAALVESGLLAGRTDLNLDDNQIGDAGVAALASCRDLAGLRSLWLWDVGMTEVGVQALLNSPHLSAELSLHSHGNAISPETQTALRERFRG